jgi:hypothetical protein
LLAGKTMGIAISLFKILKLTFFYEYQEPFDPDELSTVLHLGVVDDDPRIVWV